MIGCGYSRYVVIEKRVFIFPPSLARFYDSNHILTVRVNDEAKWS